MESFFLFTLFYFLVAICFIFPPTEFVSVGLTIESIFSHWLKNEEESFIHYHVRRTVATALMHSLLPIGYIFGLKHLLPGESLWEGNILWHLYIVTAVTIPIIVAVIVADWHRNQWRYHPIAKTLINFTTAENNINQIARDINAEYRSVDKIIVKCNAVSKVIATDNWLIKVSPYRLDVAHQSDVTLVVSSSDTHQYTPDSTAGVQYLNIDVNTARPNVKSFTIRINSSDFKDLQDKIVRPIRIHNNIVVHKTLTDRFLDIFKQQVAKNPSLPAPDNLDLCIGCMQAMPAVKLYTCCGDTSGSNKCSMCYCRPLWCVDCMGKWFASRQDQERPSTWLSSKCTCPMCRSTFCVLDVCPISDTNNETSATD